MRRTSRSQSIRYISTQYLTFTSESANMSKPQTINFGSFFRSLSHTDLSQRPEGIPNVGVKKPDKASFRSVEQPSPASWNPYEWIQIYRCPMPEGQHLMWVDHKDPEDCEVRVFGDFLPDIRNAAYSLSSTGSKTSSAERVKTDPVQRIGSLDDLHEALHTDINHSFNSHVDNNENSHNGNTRMDNDNSYNTHTSINDNSFHNPDNSVADINAHNHNSYNTNRDQSLNAIYNGDVLCGKPLFKYLQLSD